MIAKITMTTNYISVLVSNVSLACFHQYGNLYKTVCSKMAQVERLKCINNYQSNFFLNVMSWNVVYLYKKKLFQSQTKNFILQFRTNVEKRSGNQPFQC